MKMRIARKRIIVVFAVLVAMTGAAIAAYILFFRTTILVPGELRGKVPFSAVYPTSKSGMTIKTDNAQYYSSEKLVVFEGEHLAAHSRLVFSQQELPDDLKGDEGAFKAMIDSMEPYGNFNSKFGQVHLTRPPSQGERQSAVLKTSNSLIFIVAVDNLTDEQWWLLIESLVLVEQ